MQTRDSEALVLSADSVTVAYPGTKALDDVTLTLTPGRVHVLAGQNGAGKSTLIKVLSGAVVPEEGRVSLGGTTLNLRRPADATEHGIRLIPQELQLLPSMLVWENITAGESVGRWGFLDHKALKRRAATALDRLGEDIPIDVPAAELTPAEQQRVVIARSLVAEAKFLILDEPTAALSQAERSRLLDLIRNLVANEVGILFVSHHLTESMAIGHDISVLRDGKLVWTKRREEVDLDMIASAMFGEQRQRFERSATPISKEKLDGPALISAEQLRWMSRLSPISFSLPPGEILGIAGLPGSGASTLNSALYGQIPRTGRIRVGTREVAGSVSNAIRRGLGMIPSDRKAEGLFGIRSVTDNIAASSLRRHSFLGWLSMRKIVQEARAIASKVALSPPDIERAIGTFSGGNQQKALVGRWLSGTSRVLLADEPTRGVDVHARAQIHDLLRGFVGTDRACVLYSSDLAELVELSTVLLVLRRDGSSELVTDPVSPDVLYTIMSGSTAADSESEASV